MTSGLHRRTEIDTGPGATWAPVLKGGEIVSRRIGRDRRKRAKRYYDVEMIRDFLEHLRWEWAIRHFEVTHGNAENPELVDQLRKYYQKYHTIGLQKANRLVYGDASPEEIELADAVLHQACKVQAESVLKAMDLLQPALEEAFECASAPKRDFFVIKETTVKDLLQRYDDLQNRKQQESGDASNSGEYPINPE